MCREFRNDDNVEKLTAVVGKLFQTFTTRSLKKFFRTLVRVHRSICKKASGRSIHHHALNDWQLVHSQLQIFHSSKEPQGSCRCDRKFQDGLYTLVACVRVADLWSGTSQLSDSYVGSSAGEAGSAAELAASKKIDKYTGLAVDYHFQWIAVDMLDPINESTYLFLTLLAKKISHRSGDEWKTAFYFSSFLSVAAIQQHPTS